MQDREVLDRPVAPKPVPSDPEVLIREARRRTRRRRMTCTALLGVVVLGVLAGVIATRGGARRLSPVTPSSPLTVDARAFHGHGVLAFVSKGSLYVLDGASGRLVHLADARHTRATRRSRQTDDGSPTWRRRAVPVRVERSPHTEVMAPISCGSRGRTAPMRIGSRRWATARSWDGARKRNCSP